MFSFCQKIIAIFLIGLIGFIFIACDSSDDVDSNSNGSVTITFTGKLNKVAASSSSHYSAISGSRRVQNSSSPSSDVDMVVALPIYNGEIQSRTWENLVEASVGADGSFSLPILKTGGESSVDWIFALVNSTATDKKDKLVSFVVLSSEDESLIKMPISDIEGDIDFGDVTADASGDEAESSNSFIDTSESFTLSTAQLEEVAKTDNGFKIVKSAYINYDAEKNVDFSIQLRSFWTSGVITDIKNTYSNHMSDMTYDGYQIEFDLPEVNGLYSWNGVSNRTESIAFYPPSSITNGALTWDTGTPFVNDGVTAWNCETKPNGEFCSDDDFSVSYPDEGALEQTVRLGFPSAGAKIVGTIPKGYWSLQKSATEIAVFDFGIVSPFKNDDISQPTIYIPDLKISTDASNRVTEVAIKWYLRDSGSFNEITDTSVIADVVKNYMITVGDTSGDTQDYEFLRKDGRTLSIKEFENDWYFLGESDESKLIWDSAAIEYFLVSGIGYRFAWNKPY